MCLRFLKWEHSLCSTVRKKCSEPSFIQEGGRDLLRTESQRTRGYEHHFILGLHLCRLIENELVAVLPTGKPGPSSFFLIITFLAALSVISVLYICSLRASPGHKPLSLVPINPKHIRLFLAGLD